jgi:hypothetical protein
MNRNVPTASVVTSPYNLAFKGYVSQRFCVRSTQRKYETSKFMKNYFCEPMLDEEDRPARWHAYTEATERSPMGGGITELGASCLSTSIVLPASPPLSDVCKLRALVANARTLSLPAFVWAEWLDDWREKRESWRGRCMGLLPVASLQQFVFFLEAFCRVSGHLVTSCQISSDWKHVGPYIFVFTSVTSNYSGLCYVYFKWKN